MCEICSKLTIEASDIVLVSLLLTLNIFDPLFQSFYVFVVVVFADFEHVNGEWNTLLP